MRRFDLAGWRSNRTAGLVAAALALFAGAATSAMVILFVVLFTTIDSLDQILPWVVLLLLLTGGGGLTVGLMIGAPWRGERPRLLVGDDYLIVTHPGLGQPLGVDRGNVRSVTLGPVEGAEVAWLTLGGKLRPPHLVVELEQPVSTTAPRWAIRAGRFAHSLWVGGDDVLRFALRVDDHERLRAALTGWPVVPPSGSGLAPNQEGEAP